MNIVRETADFFSPNRSTGKKEFPLKPTFPALQYPLVFVERTHEQERSVSRAKVFTILQPSANQVKVTAEKVHLGEALG